MEQGNDDDLEEMSDNLRDLVSHVEQSVYGLAILNPNPILVQNKKGPIEQRLQETDDGMMALTMAYEVLIVVGNFLI